MPLALLHVGATTNGQVSEIGTGRWDRRRRRL